MQIPSLFYCLEPGLLGFLRLTGYLFELKFQELQNLNIVVYSIDS